VTGARETAPGLAPAPLPMRDERDYRLDFFRGVALVFILLDHIPQNVVAWLTLRNYGFSDATEVFVFISGYSAAIAYGSVMRDQGFLVAGARIMRRTWQLYVAHIFLFVVFTAQIAYVATRFANPMFSEEMNLIGFLNEPHRNLVEALLLKFRPANMDVLPLYIVLLATFPVLLWAMMRAPLATLAASGVLWAAAGQLNWNLPAHPAPNTWFFNPLCWQFLFALGAACALHGRIGAALAPYARPLAIAAIAYLAFALGIVSTWHFEPLGRFVPSWLAKLMYPIDKTNLDALRLLHFAAVAYLVIRLVPASAAWLRSSFARPFVRCGQHSLQIFCLGTFLSFTGHFVLVEIDDSVRAQIGVSVIGVALLFGAAYVLDWYKSATKRPARRAPAIPAPPDPMLGGEPR
jgi:hypothetical protein